MIHLNIIIIIGSSDPTIHLCDLANACVGSHFGKCFFIVFYLQFQYKIRIQNFFLPTPLTLSFLDPKGIFELIVTAPKTTI